MAENSMMMQALENIQAKLDTLIAGEQGENEGEGYENEEANEPASLENEISELESGEQAEEDRMSAESHPELANKAKADVNEGENSYNKPKIDIEALMSKMGRATGKPGIAIEVGMVGGRKENKPNPLSKFRK